MFKVLYRCNPTIERHTNSPLADPTRLCLVSYRVRREKVMVHSGS